jgi:hypothetical protein
MLVFLMVIAIGVVISTNIRSRESKTSLPENVFNYRKMITDRLAQIHNVDSDAVSNKIFQVEQAVPQAGLYQIVIELQRQKLSVTQTVQELSSGAWTLGPASLNQTGELHLAWNFVQNLSSQ